MAGTLRVSRTRGALSGVLLILLGIWGGLVPLIGPYLHFAYTPDKAWTITSGRIWLELLPAAAAIAGGVIVVTSKLRPWAMLGASLGLASGAWFAFGAATTRALMKNPPTPGTAMGGSTLRALEHFGFFTGLGAVLLCVASVALGRLSIISVRDSRVAERAAARATSPAADGPSPDDPDVTVPDAPALPARRKAPMAGLVRIASRDKSDSKAGDDTASDSGDRVTSGTRS